MYRYTYTYEVMNVAIDTVKLEEPLLAELLEDLGEESRFTRTGNTLLIVLMIVIMILIILILRLRIQTNKHNENN